METRKTLKKESSTFNLRITQELEKNIRNMCALSPANEWSGVLFYTYKGKIEDNTLELEARDFFLMDLGEHAHTVFDFDAPEITQHMFLHNLMDCSMGLIHSHCNFQAFFSGEDEDTLLAQGESMNNFLSLVVNDEGQYVARLTRKLNEKGTVKIICDGVVTSPLFKEDDYVVSKEHEEETRDYTKEDISYFELGIIKERVFSDELNDRFGQLYKAPTSYGFKKEFSTFSDFTAQNDDEPELPFEHGNPYAGVYGGYGFYGAQNQKPKETKKPSEATKPQPSGMFNWMKTVLAGGPVGKVLMPEHPVYADIYDKAFKTRKDFIDWAQNSISFNSDNLTAAEFEAYGKQFNDCLENFSDAVLSRKYKNYWKDAANEMF